MLAAPNRLRSSKDIARVYRQGAYGSGGGVLSVKALASGRAYTRAVVVVAKKVDKRAVVRNRIRRRLAELFRSQLATVRPGYDIVITVHTNAATMESAQLSAHLEHAMAQARIINS